MKPICVACMIVLLSTAAVGAADDVGALLDKALDELVGQGYVGDTSTAQRYLAAVLEQRPDHLEARWQMLSIALAPLRNVPLSERTTVLADLSPEFVRLAKIARTSKQVAFLHYMTAIHAGFYSDYERALAEIGKAVALDRRSVRYLTAQGRLRVDSGKWTKSDAEIEAGIRILDQARELLRGKPSPFVRDRDYEFYVADALESMMKPRWAEAAEHYERFIAASEPSVRQAFAWNNASVAYQRLGECAKAKAAAEKALAIAKIGMAQRNKRRAEFCLEMQGMGVFAKQSPS